MVKVIEFKSTLGDKVRIIIKSREEAQLMMNKMINEGKITDQEAGLLHQLIQK